MRAPTTNRRSLLAACLALPGAAGAGAAPAVASGDVAAGADTLATPAVTVAFRRVEDCGLPTSGPTFGGTWADLDGDGGWDLVLSRHGDEDLEVYRHAGGLRFAPLDLAVRPRGLRDHHGTAACDMDGDGDWDLFLSAGAERGSGPSVKQLWRHDGDLAFTDLAAVDSLLADPRGRGRGALWLRADADPLPELLLLNYESPPRLFGRARGAWQDWGDRFVAPADPSRWWTVAVAVDLDGDRVADLFTAGSERRLWRNAGGRFEPAEVPALPATGPAVADAAAGDLDGDGDEDLVLLLAGGVVHVLRNQSRPGVLAFTGPEVQCAAPPLRAPVSLAVADLDNDGRLDLAIAQRNGGGRMFPPLVARGRGDGTFATEPAPAGLAGVPSLATALWALDLDQDGDLELVAINGEDVRRERPGAVTVHENLVARPGITLTLIPAPGGPPQALGAVVDLVAGDRGQRRQVRCQGCPWNATVLPVHFGLGDASGPWEVTVTWPSGARQSFRLSVSGAFRLVEGSADAVRAGS